MKIKPVARINKSRSGNYVDLFDNGRNLPDETLLFNVSDEFWEVLNELRDCAECHNLHHFKDEYHDYDEPCLAMARIDSVLKGLKNDY